MSSNVPNPHDSFFKAVFTNMDRARELFTLYLPERLVNALSLDQLSLESGSFVDAELQQSHSDLLFRTAMKTGEPLWIYFLFEHRSTPEPDMPFRLVRYLVRIWEQHRHARPDEHSLPRIVPVVFYHGERTWNVPRRLSEAIEVRADLGVHPPELEYILIDLYRIPEESIRADIELLLALTLFRHIRSPRFLDVFGSVAELFRQLRRKRTGLEYIETILAYIFRVRGQEELHDAVEIIKQKETFTEEDPMGTIAEYFIEQGERRGERRGEQKGEQRGKQIGAASAFQEVLLEMLEEQFDFVPSRVTGEVRSITDPDLLRILRRKLKKCEALSDFEAILERARSQD